MRNTQKVLLAILGSVVFYGTLADVQDVLSPHPGLRDDALKQALRKEWSHQPLNNWEARKAIFNGIDGDGKKTTGRYTGTALKYTSQPLPHVAQIEHAWPKGRLPEGSTASTDLHHLFPVIPEANLARANFHYGKVLASVWEKGGSKVGPSFKARKPVFEVRKEHRGDVARAMFYMSTMYNVQIPEFEEEVLRAWHKDDPVDRAEKKRNDAVAKRQKSRNPFVDHPALSGRISNF